MTKVSYRKLSVLGLVLMGASAVTAAILPKSNTRVFSNGHLEQTSFRGVGGVVQFTCKAGEGGLFDRCDFTDTNATNPQTATSAASSEDPNPNTSANVNPNSTGANPNNTGLIDHGDGTFVSQ